MEEKAKNKYVEPEQLEMFNPHEMDPQWLQMMREKYGIKYGD